MFVIDFLHSHRWRRKRLAHSPPALQHGSAEMFLLFLRWYGERNAWQHCKLPFTSWLSQQCRPTLLQRSWRKTAPTPNTQWSSRFDLDNLCISNAKRGNYSNLTVRNGHIIDEKLHYTQFNWKAEVYSYSICFSSDN